MARYQNISDQLENLNVEDEENEDLIFEGDAVEEVNKYDLCLVGRFFTEKYQHKSDENENGRHLEANDRH